VGELTGRLSYGIVLHAASSVYPSSREGRVGSRLEGPVLIDIVNFVQCSALIQTGPVSSVKIILMDVDAGHMTLTPQLLRPIHRGNSA